MGKPIRVIGMRGKFIETEHQIVYAVVHGKKVIDYGGNIKINRAMRSSAKPIQALVCLETGAADAFGFRGPEISILAASHDGTDLHTNLIRKMLKKAGISEQCLECGLGPPVAMDFYEKMLLKGRKPKRINHNCSGKHMGILASSKHMGWPLANYRSPKHPWNKRVFELISLFTGIPANKVCYAIDGCGVPVIFTPVKESAIAYARYSTPDNLPESIRNSVARITSAVNRYPVYNSGQKRFLAALYKAVPNRFIAKEGGQGVFCLGVIGQDIGIAVKTLDGHNLIYNPYEPAVLYLLKKHKLLKPSELSKLKLYQKPLIFNSRNEVVGELKVVG